MSYLIDTNIVSGYIRGHRRIGQKVLQFGGLLSLSEISRAELLTWSYRQQTGVAVRTAITEALRLFSFLPVDADVADRFAHLHAQLLDAGKPPATFDLMIAATALVYDLTVVTRNVVDFARVPNLRIENWHDY